MNVMGLEIPEDGHEWIKRQVERDECSVTYCHPSDTRTVRVRYIFGPDIQYTDCYGFCINGSWYRVAEVVGPSIRDDYDHGPDYWADLIDSDKPTRK